MAADAEANYRYNMTIKMFGVAPGTGLRKP